MSHVGARWRNLVLVSLWCVQARKRQLIEQRLQDKLRKETDSVRRAEEAKKDKTTANRKEEELQLKDSMVRSLPHF